MKTSLLILTLIFGHVYNVSGQTDTIEQIKQMVSEIDLDATLKTKEFDAVEIYKHAFDGGGGIKISYDSRGIKKIEQEIGVSFGRLTTIVYFKDGQPIKIIDREENFKWKEDESGWDYSELHQVFQAEIYVFDWEMEEGKIIKQGKRNLSDGFCAITEYAPIIELGEELMKK